jgi:hypothetical protein
MFKIIRPMATDILPLTDWTEMMENIQVDYCYWISQKKKQGENNQ